MAYAQNPYSNWNTDSSSGGSPSILGALPYTNSSYPLPPGDLLTFTFTSLNPNILNCTVLGPNNRAYFAISTDATMPGCTARGLLQKQKISHWLRLSPDRSHRVIEIRGARYMWGPQEQYISLWTSGSNMRDRRCLARISKTYNIVSLEMAAEAMQLGLLEACVITTVLLQCGRNID
ncbi:hypothetical protein FIBSPDRAFT_856395 [Athelia psychrophila]|uniref:Uncharacterized protein n=1 Tax=Athelia psychrophila TaxID=1759441 RepID=A0A166NHP5_9AGAM|nr:hypothetical protein FIBSPDRAFT_856395 [Fibularhizoctonia sp. CBS 109695]